MWYDGNFVCAKLIALTGALLMIQGCDGRPAIAPRDAAMIATFKANRDEFVYWKNVFTRIGQNCRIDRMFGVVYIDARPCDIDDWQRLVAFMDRTRLTMIEARSESDYAVRADRPVIFSMFSEGFVTAGQGKAIDYISDYHGSLEKDLDAYNWGLIGKSKQMPSGYWLRGIESNWYVQYYAG